MSNITQLQKRIAELEAKNRKLSALKWNQQLGCYTRQAFESFVWPEIREDAVWFIFLDVDKMKKLNRDHGWDGTSRIIKQALRLRKTDAKAGQVLSGDEVSIVVGKGKKGRTPTNPQELCERIQREFNGRGASATFAYIRIFSRSYDKHLKAVKPIVEAAKKRRNGRGKIYAA